MPLSLERREGEELVLTTETGENIVVRVVKIRRWKVLLAIDAPPSVDIWRLELLPLAVPPEETPVGTMIGLSIKREGKTDEADARHAYRLADAMLAERAK